MSSISIKRLFFFTCSFVLFSCVPVHYYDLEVGQVYVDSNDKGLLPQEGTTITIDIGLIHEKVSTKMTPGYQAKLYRYRVMLDGELYSSGITGIEDLTTDIQIPLIANESYKTKSVIIEGSGSTEYNSEDHWKDWEVLFEGTQDCLAESDTLRYAQLENKRLRVDIELDSTTLFYDFLPGFSSEAFKRLLLDNTKTTNSVEGENSHPLACTCDHDHKIETYINQVTEQQGKVVNESYKVFLDEIQKIEKETINAVANKLTVNAFAKDDLIGKRKKDNLLKKLKNAIHQYWWMLFPLFATNTIDKRNAEFGEEQTFTFTNDIQNAISKNADRVAEGHLNTILDDILETSNRAYTEAQEQAAAELIVEAYQKTPTRFGDYFHESPTRVEALEAVQKTDILERNRKIYEEANRMAYEGFNRQDIVKAIRNSYKEISKRRANTIARNETARAFTQSQFEADRQFLNSVGKLENAYKVLYSRRPENEQEKICPYCSKLIEESNANPIPFEQPFLKFGESIEAWDNGKLRTFTANYEDIQGGVVHPNCYAKDTQIYTNEGWKRVDELTGEELFWSIDPETKKPEWVKANARIEGYAETLLRFKNKNFDMAVTKDHNMLVNVPHRVGKHILGKREKKLELVEAKNVKKKYDFYGGVNWEGSEPKTVKLGDYEIPSELYAKFMGYYLSEGSANYYEHKKSYQGVIAQTKYHKIFWKDLQQLPFRIWNGRDAFTFTDESVVKYCMGFGKSYEKNIPQEIKEFSPRLLKIFLDAYVLGDGNKKYNPNFNSWGTTIFTSSIKMRDDLTEIIVKAGFRPTVKLLSKKGTPYKNTNYLQNHDVWGITICNKVNACNDTIQCEEIEYHDNVYCVELEKNHTLWVMYNGKCWWSGNCQCDYRLVFKNAQGEFVKTLNKEQTHELRHESTNLGDSSNDNRDSGVADNQPQTKAVNGGKGSGNFGHAGREGEVGGSMPKGESTTETARKKYEKKATETIVEEGYYGTDSLDDFVFKCDSITKQYHDEKKAWDTWKTDKKPDLHKYQEGTANKDNFYLQSKADFKSTSRPDRKPDYVSNSGSKYWYEKDKVIRGSDHWSQQTASCSWSLDGKYQRRKAYGECDWKYFVYKTDIVYDVEHNLASIVNWKNLTKIKIITERNGEKFIDEIPTANGLIPFQAKLNQVGLETKIKNGGPGSGNFGHAGRPGEVGGSAPQGSVSESRGTQIGLGDVVEGKDSKGEWHTGSISGFPKNKTTTVKYKQWDNTEKEMTVRVMEITDEQGKIYEIPMWSSNVKKVRSADAPTDKPSERRTKAQREALDEVFKMIKCSNPTYFYNNMAEHTAIALRDELSKAKEYGVDLSEYTLDKFNGTRTDARVIWEKYSSRTGSSKLQLELSTRLVADGDGFVAKQKANYEKNWHTADDIAGIIRHELGHMRAYQIAKDSGVDIWNEKGGFGRGRFSEWKYESICRQIISKAIGKVGYTKSTDTKKGDISEYGGTNVKEAVAEAFSNPNFSDFTRKVANVMLDKNLKFSLNNLDEKIENKAQPETPENSLCSGYPMSKEDWEILQGIRKEPTTEYLVSTKG